ncbi:MAG: hypothetical protein H7X84_12850 [Verrucomicrobia bacterium]|nr:hypothetical protein [Prolixibacteraceae bacterium]
MDKRKLVNIIIKDLEEIKILSEEVAESDNDSSLILGLALNKARLLCQEIELLCELTTKSAPIALAAQETVVDNEEEYDDVEDHTYADPELEIINAEEDGFEQEEELPQEEEVEEDEEADFSGEEDEDEDYALEEDQEEDMTETMEEDEDQEEPELPVEEEPEEEPEEDWNEPEVQEPVAEEKPEPAESIQSTELKNVLQPGMREIHIDDMDDDDDIQPIRFSPPAGANTRPPMREIPKPEDVISDDNAEKKFVGDKYHTERSLNDTMGENKTMDSKLANGPILSLKAAIGLNDRFLFIREIFNNNSARYNDVIDRLDKMEHISEAVEFLKANLSMQKNEASMKFVELLKRRFTK